LHGIIKRCLATDKKNRPGNVAELKNTIETLIQSESIGDKWPEYVSFEDYVDYKKQNREDIPIYAVRGDEKYTQWLSHPRIRPIIESYIEVDAPYLVGQILSNGVLVGPKQFSRLYNAGAKCANILGIPIPRIIVYADDNWNA